MSAVPVPGVRLIIDGRDLTDRIMPRLSSLTLQERRDDGADQLDLTINDTDGTLALPRTGVTISLALGWLSGDGVQVGLVDKGQFIVDEVEASGPPDIITIRARSADLTGALTRRRDKSWHGMTLGDIVRSVAMRHSLKPRCAPALADIPVEAKAQSRESDLAFLRRLGRENDAVATIKHGTLILAPIGAGTTVSGQPLPTTTINRRDGDRYSYRQARREDSAGVTASWHDRKSAKMREVTVGDASKARRLSRTYASEASARRAAKAEMGHRERERDTLELTLAYGRADLAPEQRVTAIDFLAEINANRWLIAEVSHATDGRQGFTTQVKLEG